MALFTSRPSLSLVLVVCTFFGSASPQTSSNISVKRRLVQQSAPAYPRLARSMSLEGTVRLEVLVSPDGMVKTADIKGGHPVLAQAAVTAVRQWRWERAPLESKELVELKFARE